MLLKITLKRLSLRVVLDLLNQVVNVDAMWSFHHRIRHSWDVEVNVLLVDCTVELVVRVKWYNVTIFFKNKLFFHYVCACTWFHKLTCSIVSMHDAKVFRLLRFPRSIWRTKFLQKFTINLLWTGRFFLSPQKHVLCPQVSPIDHRLDWVWIGLVWRV